MISNFTWKSHLIPEAKNKGISGPTKKSSSVFQNNYETRMHSSMHSTLTVFPDSLPPGWGFA